MNLANNISILRIILVPVFVVCLLYANAARGFLYTAAVGIFLFACFTDALDGYIARRFNQKSVIGSYLDPIADKMLLISGFLSLSLMAHLPRGMHIPAWVTVSVIARDIIIFTGAIIIFLTTGTLKAEPLIIGKVTTFFQMLTLFLALITVQANLKMTAFILTVTLTIFSGIQYIRMGGKILKI